MAQVFRRDHADFCQSSVAFYRITGKVRPGSSPADETPATQVARNWRINAAAARKVRHRRYRPPPDLSVRGVIFDIDAKFSNTEEWWLAIPEEIRPIKDQPFYHLYAENAETEYVAYVSEQNLLPDTSGLPFRHQEVAENFILDDTGRYRPKTVQVN
jgi:heat shock protein HspQ